MKMRKQEDLIMRGMEPTTIVGCRCDYEGCKDEPVYTVVWVLNEDKKTTKHLCREHTDLAIEESKILFEFTD